MSEKINERVIKPQVVESRRHASLATTVTARMAGGERRLQIVLVAMRLFSQKGFRGTTTKQIAAAAGVSEAIIFRHFATKKELYAAILDHKACAVNASQLHEVVAGAVADGDDQAVFSGLAVAMLRHHEEDAEFLRLLLFSALEGHELHQMFWDRNVRQLADFLRAYTRERQRRGAFRSIDPAIIVRAFTGMIIHHSLVNTLFDRSRSLLNIEHETAAREFTNILLYGVAVPDTPHLAKRKRAIKSTRATSAKKKERK